MDLIAAYHLLNENRWNFSRTSFYERKAKLQRLKLSIENNREEIKKALYADFKKPYPESELTEIHTVFEEINFAQKNLKKWMKPKSVSTPLVLFGSYSKINYEAKGISLIMSPWNYPFYLVISPLVSAISAGCVTIVRPSEKASATSKIIKKILDEVFSTNEVFVALGDLEVSKQLLELRFDHIFYTGSTTIGKIVMEKASKNLTSVTLELGGKSPVIIDREVDLIDAAKKIVWGKFLNAGQTCVAPDYVFVPKELKENFLQLVSNEIKKFYGETITDRKKSNDFAHIIDERNFDRLVHLCQSEHKLLEDLPSKEDHLYIPPTVLPNINESSLIMKEEIFGPILPIMTYESIDEVISYIRKNEKPLALYLFSKNKLMINKILNETTSGGVAINHVLMHLSNPHLPFGGIGHSGMGGSHGHFGFKAFTHEKAVLIQTPITLSTLYFPPYSTWLSKLAYKLLRYLE
jgi:aldehyde dehydrogenase (NAD+)